MVHDATRRLVDIETIEKAAVHHGPFFLLHLLWPRNVVAVAVGPHHDTYDVGTHHLRKLKVAQVMTRHSDNDTGAHMSQYEVSDVHRHFSIGEVILGEPTGGNTVLLSSVGDPFELRLALCRFCVDSHARTVRKSTEVAMDKVGIGSRNDECRAEVGVGASGIHGNRFVLPVYGIGDLDAF